MISGWVSSFPADVEVSRCWRFSTACSVVTPSSNITLLPVGLLLCSLGSQILLWYSFKELQKVLSFFRAANCFQTMLGSVTFYCFLQDRFCLGRVVVSLPVCFCILCNAHIALGSKLPLYARQFFIASLCSNPVRQPLHLDFIKVPCFCFTDFWKWHVRHGGSLILFIPRSSTTDSVVFVGWFSIQSQCRSSQSYPLSTVPPDCFPIFLNICMSNLDRFVVYLYDTACPRNFSWNRSFYLSVFSECNWSMSFSNLVTAAGQPST